MGYPDGGVSRPVELSRDEEALPPSETETATFGMGCFWGPEARFGAIEGVVRTRVGYAGGTKPDPDYHTLGDHTEVVQVEYDPGLLDYTDLLEVFWSNHAPTRNTGKRQYRNVVLTTSASQREAARRTRDTVADQMGGSIATTIEELDLFYLAEQYHQKYELRSTPIIGDELEDIYGDSIVDSTVATRLNGFVAGHGDEQRRHAFLADLDLPPAALAEVQRRL